MIAHVDLDAFFASVESRDHSELRNKPIVVAFVTPQGEHCNRGVVSAASYEARTWGIYSGMSLWEAKKRCPKLIIVASNFAKYDKASKQMYQIINNYSPEIEPLSLDEAFASFYDCESLYGDLNLVCQKIKREIKDEIGITASIGLATNKLVAKIASDFQKPNGLTIVAKGFEKDFLAPLPLIKLYGLGKATAAKLQNLGIKTIGELAKMDKNYLVGIFGKYGQTLHTSANGLGSNKIAPPMVAKSIGRSTTFAHDSAAKSYLIQNLVYLSEKVAAALVAAGLEGFCQTLTLRDHNFKTWSHQKVLTTAILTADRILNLAKNLLDQAWDQTTPLRLLGISISNLKPISNQLFLWPELEKEKVLQKAMIKIRSQFGFWSIHPASIKNNLKST